MPVICTLASSSRGNASFVAEGETSLLLDAGISLRRLSQGLAPFGTSPGRLSAVLITHEHSDHIMGLPLLAAKYDVPIYCTRGTARALQTQFPNLRGRMRTFFAGDVFSVGDFEISTFPTSHDCAESVGYVMQSGCGKVALATDLGCVTGEVEKALRGVDFLMLEANHDIEKLWMGSYPVGLKKRILGKLGHLNNEDSAGLAVYAARNGTKMIVLVHLSQENNTPNLAIGAVSRALEVSGAGRVMLEAAPPQTSGNVYILK